jgi:hypothetical protein
MGNFHIAYGAAALIVTVVSIFFANVFVLSLYSTGGDWLMALGEIFSIDWLEANFLMFFGDFDSDLEFNLLNIIMSAMAPFVAFSIPLRKV